MGPAQPLQPDPEAMLAHAGWLEELARRLVGPAGAADLVQDTWVAALERPPRGAGPLGPWLRTVLWRLAGDRRQGDAARRARQEGAARDEAQADTLELIARAELHEILIRALLVLAEPYRTVLLLRYFERLSPAEIARRRGVAASTVRTQLERGLARLREQLDARFGGRRDTWCALITDALGPGALGAGAGAFSVGLSSGAIAMKAAVGAVIGAAVVGAVLWGVTGRGGGRAIEPDPGSAAVRGPVERAAAQPDEAPPASAERAPAQAAGRAEAAAVPAAAEAEAAPEAAPPIRILARLTGPEGAVLAGGELALVEPLYAALRATADWRGEALLELERIVRSSQGTVEASAAGYATLRLKVRLEPGAELSLGTLELGPGGAVEGRVVLPGGAPVARAELLDAHPARTASVGRDLFGFGSRAEDRIVHAAEDGSFRLEGVPAGPRRVWARSKGHGWTASELLEVPTGGTAGPLLIELAGGQRNLIAGQVVDPEGRPVAGAQIDLRSATMFRPGHRADARNASSSTSSPFPTTSWPATPKSATARSLPRAYGQGRSTSCCACAGPGR